MAINWAKVTAFVLRLIADGLDSKAAISQASAKFGVSASDIKARM